MARFTLSWRYPKRGEAVLVFDKKAWRIFERTAKDKHLSADEMIAVAVARLVGDITRYRRRS